MWELIYILGCIVSYYMLRYINKGDNDWTWETFFKTVLISFLSWFIIFIFIIAGITMKILDYIDDEPPKWL